MATFQLHHQTLITIEYQSTRQDESNEPKLDGGLTMEPEGKHRNSIMKQRILAVFGVAEIVLRYTLTVNDFQGLMMEPEDRRGSFTLPQYGTETVDDHHHRSGDGILYRWRNLPFKPLTKRSRLIFLQLGLKPVAV
ncbi:hypothetical protein EVAR_23465_1 [Eumeta japonica]|uniref:Uncharacterized protein n=1 Tax=Eumeta variegata TaxID=151549 RepID=A0A4C1ULF3_EUMVA|nr:hypothetical protein EVAR_23465_1 [Eumeta japonica]